jgi:hypothetical protein
MESMSTPISGGVATRIVAPPHRTRRLHRLAPVASRLARTLWLRDRGVNELRWAAITLATMALLGLGATWLDPASGDFDRVVLFSTPAALIVTTLAWSRAATRLGRSKTVRLMLGPGVLIVAAAGCGLTDPRRCRHHRPRPWCSSRWPMPRSPRATRSPRRC